MSDKSKVLIVDDDIPFVSALYDLLDAQKQCSPLQATKRGEDIFALKKEKIAGLVINLNAKNLDVLNLLSLLSNQYRHIQCIIITNVSHPSLEKVEYPSKDSVFLYLAKPSNLENICAAVVTALQRLDENDYEPGLSVKNIVAFFEVLEKTCQVQVKLGSKKEGLLEFFKGTLVHAVCEKKRGIEAAAEMFTWPPLGFTIESETLPTEETISPSDLELLRVTSRLKKESEPIFNAMTEEQKITLFIVDDSRMMRKVIANIFKDDPYVRVVGEAENGEEALQLIPQLKPDVVTLDVEMPVMDGLKTIKRLMIQAPTPTVMLSSMTQDGAAVTFDALKYGAVDFVAKPSRNMNIDLAEQTRDIIRKIHLAAEVELEAVRYVRAITQDKKASFPAGARCEKLVAIGAAEGGYGSLLKILPHLATDFLASYLIMFYAPSKHLDSFVEYISQFCPLRVQRATNNIPLEAGVCYFASGEEYLTVHEIDGNLVLHQSNAPFANQRGSINMLFFSVAEVMQEDSAAVVLSGMGEDGTEGMAEILRVGGAGIVQDTNGCLYRDMPRAVAAHCPEAAVLPDGSIAETLQGILSA